MVWIAGIQRAVNYIEDNLTETIDYEEAAKQCYSSSYHFQRVFSILCGYTVGEYIRNRRLTLAGKELATTNAKVIDVALKYGYESPDSFAKAFQKFHGILPSQARNNGSNLKSFSRLVLKFSLEGGTTMNYRIETKPAMTLIGYKKRFSGTPYDTSRKQQEADFFTSTRASQWMLKGMSKINCRIIVFLLILMMRAMTFTLQPQCMITNATIYITAMLRELTLWKNSILKKSLFRKEHILFLKRRKRECLFPNILNSANKLPQSGCLMTNIR